MNRKARPAERMKCQELGCSSSAWHADCPLHGKANGLQFYVLFNDTTSDYPGEWVVRRQEVKGGEILNDPYLLARGATREECVANLLEAHPHVGSMTYLARQSEDDPVIAGTFL